jgi:putative ABC transport system ATP-binding protein
LDTRNTDIVLDILLKLNRDDGITMVMVTHDMTLKHFANKVVRMVDGKIAKVELQHDEIRNKAI